MLSYCRWVVLAACTLLMFAGCDKGVHSGKTDQDIGVGEIATVGDQEKRATPTSKKDDEDRTYEGKSVSAWINQLDDNNKNARLKAAEAFGKMFRWDEQPPEVVLQALARSLKDKDEVVRFVASQFLIRCGEHGTPFLLEALKDMDAVVRRLAADALGGGNQTGMGRPSESGVPVLAEALLKDKDAEVRQSAAMSLCRFGKPAVASLIKAVKSGDSEARRLSVNALGRIGPKASKAVQALIELLKEDDEKLRCEIVRALGQIGNETGEVLPALLTTSKDNDDAGKEANEHLKRINKAPRSSAAALLPFLKDAEPYIRFKAAEVLCEMEEGDQECLASLLELIKRRNSQVRANAARLLYRYGSAAKQAVPALVEVLRNDPVTQTRAEAINVLGAIGPEAKDAIPALKAAQEDKQLEPAVRQALKKIEQ